MGVPDPFDYEICTCGVVVLPHAHCRECDEVVKGNFLFCPVCRENIRKIKEVRKKRMDREGR